MSTPARAAVSVILPIRPGTTGVLASIAGWVQGLNSLGHPWELLVVDDGTGLDAAAIASQGKHIRVLSHASAQGFGACIRTALPEAAHELVAYVSLDYPYSQADLGKLLERIAHASEMEDLQTGEIVQRTPDFVSGCRTGIAVPALWAIPGGLVRFLSRYVLGMSLEKLPGWYGFGEFLRSWRAWIVYGVPFYDPNSAFKLFKKSAVDQFPIQSDGDFVHIELAAKCTFLNCIFDEIALSPKANPVPFARWDRADRKKVFSSPKFAKPKAVPVPPPAPEPEPVPVPVANG